MQEVTTSPLSSPDLDTTTVGRYSTAQVRERARLDMNYLAALALPDVCEAPFPKIFVGMWALVTGALGKVRDFSKFALGLPRGHGKTTVIKLLVLYTILFTTRRFVLIIGSSEDRAQNILADVCDILDSPNIQNVFGNWRANCDKDSADQKRFVFCGRSIILAALGSGSSVRGLNIKNARPDFIITDDMQTQKESESESTAKKLLQWFVGTLMKSKNPKNCTFLYVGNMYRDIRIQNTTKEIYTCILRNLQKNPSWISWIVGGILADGKALWEEVQPYEQLMSEFENDASMGQADIFFAEVQNDPECGGGNNFDLSKVPEFNIDSALESPVGKFLQIDPSLGQKKSDAQVVGEYWVYSGGIPVLQEIHIKQVTAPQLVKWCVDYSIAKGIPLICSEIGAYQGTLLQWFEKEAQDRQLQGIFFRPVSPKGRTKASRIINMFKALMAGTTKIHPACFSRVYSQIQVYDPLKSNNTDDIIDNIAYAEEAVGLYSMEMVLPDIYALEPDQWGEELEVDNVCF